MAGTGINAQEAKEHADAVHSAVRNEADHVHQRRKQRRTRRLYAPPATDSSARGAA